MRPANQDDRNTLSPAQAGVLGSRRRRLLLSVVVAVAGIVLSFVAFRLLLTREQQLADAEFRHDAARRAEAVQREMHDRVNMVAMLSAFYAGSEVVQRKEFQTFVAPLLRNRKGVQFMGWAPCVPAASRERYEQSIRGHGFPKYEITQRDDRGQLVRAGKRAEYFPILFIEPPKQNESLFGFDIASNAKCNEIIRKTMAANQPVAGACTLMTDAASDRVCLYVAGPARNGDVPDQPPTTDPLKSDGVVFGVFSMDAIVAAALLPFSGKEIAVSVVAAPGHGDASSPGSIEVAGSRWNVVCRPSEDYLEDQRTWAPAHVLVGGLLITALLVGGLLFLAGRTARVERLVAERTSELRESEQRFRQLVDNAGDTFILHNEEGRILDVNKTVCERLGYTREELLSMTVSDIDPDVVPKNHPQYWHRPFEEYPVSFEGIHRCKDGSTYPVDIRLTCFDAGGHRMILGLGRDATERKRAEEALDSDRRLLRHTLDLHEQDRKLVAYEIHDGLAQQLTGALFKFQSVEVLRERDPDAAREMFDGAVRVLRDAMVETRRLISGLRPPELDESGVVDAIAYLISERRQRGGPEIEFAAPAEFGRLVPPLESAIFRIVQECLTNACRYSQSEKVRVELAQTGDRVHVEVRDWGIGFDSAHIEHGHYGLQGIRERARLLGGAAAIETAPGQGTRISVDFPLVPPLENGIAKNGG